MSTDRMDRSNIEAVVNHYSMAFTKAAPRSSARSSLPAADSGWVGKRAREGFTGRTGFDRVRNRHFSTGRGKPARDFIVPSGPLRRCHGLSKVAMQLRRRYSRYLRGDEGFSRRAGKIVSKFPTCYDVRE